MFLHSFLKKSTKLVPKISKLTTIPQNNIILHEYQVHDIFKEYKLPLLQAYRATHPEDAKKLAEQLERQKPRNNTSQFTDFVVKAQVHAGGRGKGYFKESSLQGGVQFAHSPEEVGKIAEKMIGKTLITKQTGSRGRNVASVMITERIFLRKEMYFSITLDRTRGGLCIICNEKGGVNIEEGDPKQIRTFFLEPGTQIPSETLNEIIATYKLGPAFDEQLKNVVTNLYKCFIDNDATLLEINPLGLTIDNQIKICDQKMNIDDNSSYRQPRLSQMEDITQKDWKEIEAQRYGLNYIALDGNIGCMVNGAGLAMATMDIIKQKNGMPANFLDCGGRADDTQVVEALKIMDNDPNVEAILVNIFAGITKCDIICLGLIKGMALLGMKKPIVLRLKGNNVDAAKEIIQNSGFNLIFTEDLDEAAEKAVKTAMIIRMAKEAKINLELTS
ncbi:hypothetical protein ABPG74_001166 [Tetrahymena malaccensis]